LLIEWSTTVVVPASMDSSAPANWPRKMSWVEYSPAAKLSRGKYSRRLWFACLPFNWVWYM
jgi:hypothetical protein